MSGAPGRIAREFSAVIPTTRDADPLEVQESTPFKEAVAEVGRAFREVDVAAEARALARQGNDAGRRGLSRWRGQR